MVSLAGLGVGAVAAAPTDTTGTNTGTVADADGTDCAGTVCEAPCDVAEKLGKEWDCVQSTSTSDGSVTVVAAEGTDCVGCPVDCAKGDVQRIKDRGAADVVKNTHDYLVCPE